jgi:signal transduction histidine kinase
MEIIDHNGNVVYEHNNMKSIPHHENVFDVLKKGVFKDNGSIKQTERQIYNRKLNSNKISYKGEEYYLSYAAINLEDWGVLHIVPQRVINDEVTRSARYSYMAIIGVVISICILIILALQMTVRMRRNIYVMHIQQKANKVLKKAVDEANYANKAKSDFLAHMSHDIRTPINGIVGMSVIARKNIDDKECIEKCLDNIEISSNHLVSLINDVLDMSRIETGNIIIKHEPFCLLFLLSASSRTEL